MTDPIIKTTDGHIVEIDDSGLRSPHQGYLETAAERSTRDEIADTFFSLLGLVKEKGIQNTLESEGSHHAREQGRRVQNLQAEMRNTQNPVQESHPEYLDAQIFYHQFQVKLGERGRINLPSQWVNKFQNIGGYENQFLVTPITDHENPHIQVYIANPPECNHILKPVRGVNTGSQKYITSIDTSGRIGISTGLRQELGWEAPLPVTLEGHANYFTIHKK